MILGPRWEELHPSVRQLHDAGEPLRVAGTFRIRRGGWLTRRLAWIAGLPREGDRVPLQLVVTPTGDQEEWHRAFAGRPFVSLQWKHAEGFLLEQMGIFVQRFRLNAVDGSLRYENDGSSLRLGPYLLPLPGWLAPRVTASEVPSDDGIAVSVETTLPLLGLLVAYEGTVRIEDSHSC